MVVQIASLVLAAAGASKETDPGRHTHLGLLPSSRRPLCDGSRFQHPPDVPHPHGTLDSLQIISCFASQQRLLQLQGHVPLTPDLCSLAFLIDLRSDRTCTVILCPWNGFPVCNRGKTSTPTGKGFCLPFLLKCSQSFPHRWLDKQPQIRNGHLFSAFAQLKVPLALHPMPQSTLNLQLKNLNCSLCPSHQLDL